MLRICYPPLPLSLPLPYDAAERRIRGSGEEHSFFPARENLRGREGVDYRGLRIQFLLRRKNGTCQDCAWVGVPRGYYYLQQRATHHALPEEKKKINVPLFLGGTCFLLLFLLTAPEHLAIVSGEKESRER